ncbi:MAG: hypothetical protein M9945_04995 [Aquamicrobium sp.]|nr:hypothetical protein [Aquamicrobium sp.]
MTLREVYAARAENRRRMRSASPRVREIREKLAALYDDLIVAMMKEDAA